MLMYISKMITSFLFSDKSDPQQRIICEYGCEIWLYTSISTIGLLLIGSFFHSLYASAIMIMIFYLCQSSGGGYHASTHMKCFAFMAFGLIFSLLILHANLPIILYYFLLCISSSILLLFPLKLHQNKQYLKDESDKLKKRSRMITLSICFFAVLSILFDQREFLQSGTLSLMCSSVSRLSAYKAEHDSC